VRLLASDGLVAAGVLIVASKALARPASPPPGVLYYIANESFYAIDSSSNDLKQLARVF
jgi:hypothetical protein